MIFKQQKNEKTVISVRLDVALLARIDQMAADKNLSRNEIICQGITFALDQEEQENTPSS